MILLSPGRLPNCCVISYCVISPLGYPWPGGVKIVKIYFRPVSVFRLITFFIIAENSLHGPVR